jgi:catechol-2,3-dioxygenase
MSRAQTSDATTAAPAVTVDGLAEVVLNVRDMAAALAFYRDLLGLRVISPPERTTPVFLQAGVAATGVPSLVVLVQLPPDAAAFTPPRTLHHLALTVPADVFDSTHEALSATGLTVRTGRHPVLTARTIYVDDPDGNEVEFIAPA